MIRASRSMILACAGAALALHGAGLWVSEPRATIEIEAGAGAHEAMLGSSFADMVAGAAQPVSASTAAPNRQSDQVVAPTAPDDAMRFDTPDAAQAAPRRATPVKPGDTASRSSSGHFAPRSRTASAVKAALPEVAAKPVQDVDAAKQPDAVPATPAEPRVQPTPPQKVIDAAPEADGLQVSRRPQPRPRAVEQAAARQASEPERKSGRAGRPGNSAARDANRGSTSGVETSTAARQGRDSQSRNAEQGNAATSNYPGVVMRHLARVQRPRATSRGAAMVRFSIGTGGRLASVGLARSSGSSRLDRAALTVVRRAAPFPDPPAGAQRSFSVKIEGR